MLVVVAAAAISFLSVKDTQLCCIKKAKKKHYTKYIFEQDETIRDNHFLSLNTMAVEV